MRQLTPETDRQLLLALVVALSQTGRTRVDGGWLERAEVVALTTIYGYMTEAELAPDLLPELVAADLVATDGSRVRPTPAGLAQAQAWPRHDLVRRQVSWLRGRLPADPDRLTAYATACAVEEPAAETVTLVVNLEEIRDDFADNDLGLPDPL